MQLTKNFNLKELCKSNTAKKLCINNKLNTTNLQHLIDNYSTIKLNTTSLNSNDLVLFKLLSLCTKLLQPLRDSLNKPVTITSGYRCQELNQAIGGALKSQHCKGEAVDITVKGYDTKELFNFIIASKLEFDQIILEFYNPKNPLNSWVHVSYKPQGNRNQKLIATKLNGKTVYKEIN